MAKPKTLAKSDEGHESELAQVLDIDTEVMIPLRKTLEEAGLKGAVVERMLLRARSQHQPAHQELRRVKTKEFQELLDDRIYRALMYLDDYSLAASSAKDIAIIVGIFLEKRQLLRGEPTHILSIEERGQLNSLVPMLIKEATRRGLVFEDRGDIIDVTPTGEGTAHKGRLQRVDDLRRRDANAMKDEIGEPS